MLTPERFNGSMTGKPGATVSEEFSEKRGWFLYYAYYDNYEQLVGYAEFPRDTSPEEMSRILNESADNLLQYYPESMTWEEACREAEGIRRMADSVPGLRE